MSKYSNIQRHDMFCHKLCSTCQHDVTRCIRSDCSTCACHSKRANIEPCYCLRVATAHEHKSGMCDKYVPVVDELNAKSPTLFTVTAWCKEHTVSIELHRYLINNSLAIQLISQDPESRSLPYAVITVNIPDEQRTDDTCQFVDVNNCPWAEAFIIAHGLGRATGRTAVSGWCKYPEYSFDINKLREVTNDVNLARS